MGKSEVHTHRCEYYLSSADAHMGVKSAPKCRNLSLVRTADMSIAVVRVRFIGVGVSIPCNTDVRMGVN